MKLSDIDHSIRRGIIVFTVSGILIVLFFLVCTNIGLILKAVNTVLGVLMPFLIGILFALILQPLRSMIEMKWLVRLQCAPRTRRKLATGITMLVFFLCFLSFFAVLIPQLISSVSSFADNADSYAVSFNSLLRSLHLSNQDVTDSLNRIMDSFAGNLSAWLLGAQGGLLAILSYSFSFVQNVINFFIGLIITIYLLTDEERFKRQMKKMMYTILSENAADNVLFVCRLTVRMFSRFVFGKAVDSLIIGVICWAGCMVLRIPYAVLIGFVVGVTNMIPIFGPFIGAIPCGIILLLVKPISAAVFAVFIFVLQQLDGNVIGPYILGDSMGLPPLWVMFAIITGGAMFGLIGMFLGVPLFSVIYYLTSEAVNRHIYRHRIDIEKK